MNRFLSLIAASSWMCMPAAAQQAPLGLQFLYKADTDGDGNITRQELKNFRSKGFARADRDRDGFISLKDVPSRFQARAKDYFGGIL